MTGIRGLGTTHTTHGLALLRQRNYSRLIQLPHAAHAAVLNTFTSVRWAEYRHGNRNGCLEGSRRAIPDERVELWIRDFGKPPA